MGDFETYHRIGIQSQSTSRTAKFFVRRVFLRMYVEIIKTLNSSTLNQYYLFIHILIYSKSLVTMESEHESYVVSCLHVVFLTFLLSQFFVLRIYKTKAVK